MTRSVGNSRQTTDRSGFEHIPWLTTVPIVHKLTAQILVHLGCGSGSVNRDNQLFSAKQLQDRFRLGVIILQARLDGFWCVVGSGNQRCATDIAPVGQCRSVEDQVVIHATLQAEAAVEDALLNHCIGYLNQKHSVDIVTLQKERRLPGVTREAV